MELTNCGNLLSLTTAPKDYKKVTGDKKATNAKKVTDDSIDEGSETTSTSKKVSGPASR